MIEKGGKEYGKNFSSMRQRLRKQLCVPDDDRSGNEGDGCRGQNDHIDLSSVAGQKADIIISGKNFETQFAHLTLSCPVVFLERLVDKNEIREKFTPVLKEIGAI